MSRPERLVDAMLALLDALDPEALIARGGLAIVAAIVFAESGLLVGFMLPGDSLLFIAGFLASSAGGHVLPPIWVVVPVVIVAAIAGDQAGYVLGHRVGGTLMARPRSRLFDPRNVERAEVFFDRHGNKTIVLARFVPIVRTFAPVVAGVGSMRYRTFFTYNVIGGVAWGAGLTLLGYALGGVDVVRENVEVAVLTIVGISLLPALVELIRHRRRASAVVPAPEAVEAFGSGE
jgi:membrane-associated protein